MVSEKIFLDKVRTREDIPRVLPNKGSAMAIELGLADGGFSEKLVQYGNIGFLYSIDAYAGDRSHNVDEYKVAFGRLDRFRYKNSILRMTFAEAVTLFPDNYFDLVYVDGYAHDGEDNGRTLYDWWPKVKRHGIFAGHDYDKQWPLVVEQVDKFAQEKRVRVCTIKPHSNPMHKDYQGWLIFKP